MNKPPRMATQLFVLTLPAVLAIAMGNARHEAAPAAQVSAPADAAVLARGEYVAKAADCAGCHTAPEGGAPFAGGLGMGSPFGTIKTSNITPDPRYGIGRYSLEDFDRAVRHGVAPGGKALYPAMPYPEFSKMSDGDLHALYAYLMNRVAPVAKPNEPADVAFPFNQRWTLFGWQLAFMPHGGFRSHASSDVEWKRGAYLVQSLGHCGACHTPRGWGYQELGYDESASRFLTGGVNDHWFAANLTGDAGSGLGRLSEMDIAHFLKTGHAGGNVAYGSMVEQIEDSTQYLSDADLLAVAHYLKSLPPQQPSGTYAPATRPARAPTNGNRVSDSQSLGYVVYQSFCAVCHGENGKGVPMAIPALAGNPSVLAKDTTSLIRLMVEGGNSPSTLTGPPRQRMPGFAGTLSNAQMADALTYIRSAWGNVAQPISGNDVASLRQILHK
jgi:alcohol dehydrogenase (quinone), cytochrome c subunit